MTSIIPGCVFFSSNFLMAFFLHCVCSLLIVWLEMIRCVHLCVQRDRTCIYDDRCTRCIVFPHRVYDQDLLWVGFS